jgi:hypothetical protein
MSQHDDAETADALDALRRGQAGRMARLWF